MGILKQKFAKPTATQIAMAEAFAKACQKERRLIQTNELPIIGGSYMSEDKRTGKKVKTALHRNGVNHHFGNMETFIEFSRITFEKLFAEVIEEKVYIPKKLKKLEELLGKHRRVIVTSANADAYPNLKACEALKSYAKKKDAIILVIPCDNRYEEINEFFHDNDDFHVVFDEISLNKSIFVSNVKVQPNTVAPLSGLADIAKRNDKSMIVGSPKLCLEDIPNKKGEAPLRLMATGSITKPNYKSHKYTSLKKNYKATEDHVMGAVIVELENDDIFYSRQIEFENNGSFIDLGVKYYADGKTEQTKDAVMVLGDLHSIEKDEEAFHYFVETVGLKCGVSEIGLQDFVDGESITHHDQNRIAKRAAMALEDRLDLSQEFRIARDDLNYVTKQKHIKKVFIVPSNHNEFVDRWLDNSRWINDAQNGFMGAMIYPYCIASYIHRQYTAKVAMEKIANKLKMTVQSLKAQLPHLANAKSPIQIGIEMFGVNDMSKITWLNRDEHYNKYGCELGHHGDIGANGSKFSAKSASIHYGKAFVGHSHTANISSNSMIWTVGCLEHLNPEYARGASSWSHTSGILYSNGSRQLLTRVNGKCFLDDKKRG